MTAYAVGPGGSLNCFNSFLTEPTGAVIPILQEPPDHRKVVVEAWLGDNVLLPCVAKGFPVPEST